ncbi:MAG: hypothetical protein MUF42_13930 [Cytophagaceae bacterium]|jgi:uncharacterized repeat protein (TIGR01451 family)|nr:hypothetical protein [Cytophagaceae bacterium]
MKFKILLITIIFVNILGIQARVIYKGPGQISPSTSYQISQTWFPYNHFVILDVNISLNVSINPIERTCSVVPGGAAPNQYFLLATDAAQIFGHAALKFTMINTKVTAATFQISDYFRQSISTRFNNQSLSCSTSNVVGNSYPIYPIVTTVGSLAGINSTQYLALKFIRSGLTYYGWALFDNLNKRIVEAAYESIPGFPIVVGDKGGYFGPSSKYNTIIGVVYHDQNGNCRQDANEIGIANVPVFAAGTNFATFTDSIGKYELLVPDGTATYNIDLTTNPYPGFTLTKTCPAGSNVVSVSVFGSYDQKFVNLAATPCAVLKVNVVHAPLVRCRRSSATVQFENTGWSDVANGRIQLVLPPQIKPIQSSPAWTSKNGDTLVYQRSNFKKGTKATITIIDSVLCGDESIRGLDVCFKAFISPSMYCLSPSFWDGSELTLEASCEQNQLRTIIHNTGAPMRDSVSYRILADNILVKTGKCFLSANESKRMMISALGRSMRIEIDQSAHHPQLAYRAVAIEGCAIVGQDSISKGFAARLPFPRTFGESVFCSTILDSYDPNIKEALPKGVGAEHFIKPNEDLVYTIHFQNTGTAPAYSVVLVDTLSQHLDLSSLEVLASSHTYKLQVQTKNPAQLIWIFGGINLPDSNSNEPKSHGFVSFKIAQKNNLPLGTVIQNKAAIYFDYNSPIITNTTYHTIGNPRLEQLLVAQSLESSKDVCSGTEAQLQTNATGFGEITYLWLKDGIKLEDKTSPMETFNFQLNDEGRYTCRISNPFDTVFSAPIQVTVHTSPGILVQEPTPICDGTTFDLTKSFIDTNASGSTYSFWKEENFIHELSNPTQVGTAGTYYIKAMNGSCVDSAPITLNVKTCTDLMESIPGGVNIFPNPCSDKLHLTCESAFSFTLSSSLGVPLISGNESSIDLRSLPSGIYFLKLKFRDTEEIQIYEIVRE